MKTGRIYIAENKINGKCYIGQTVSSLRKRASRHIADALYTNDSYAFHKAIRKYGREAFNFRIIEDNISLEQLDEREKYWIAYYHSYIYDEQCNGYNMTQGGNTNLKDALRKLSDKDINKIKSTLINTTLPITQIAKIFNVSIYAISDINNGKSWYQSDIIHPLRKHNQREITYHMYFRIIEMLKSNWFSANYIASKFNITESVVSNINTGKYRKFSKIPYTGYPIQKHRVAVMGKITVKDVMQLMLDYISGKYTRKELASKYNITEHFVKNIAYNHSKKIFLNLYFPLKSKAIYNTNILNLAIKLYDQLDR